MNYRPEGNSDFDTILRDWMDDAVERDVISPLSSELIDELISCASAKLGVPAYADDVTLIAFRKDLTLELEQRTESAPEPEDFDTDAEFEAALNRHDRIKHLAETRDLNGEQALRSLAKLRNDIERAEIAIRSGMAGKAMSASDAVLHHQALLDPVTQATEFVTLWNAVGVLSR